MSTLFTYPTEEINQVANAPITRLSPSAAIDEVGRLVLEGDNSAWLKFCFLSYFIHISSSNGFRFDPWNPRYIVPLHLISGSLRENLQVLRRIAFPFLTHPATLQLKTGWVGLLQLERQPRRVFVDVYSQTAVRECRFRLQSDSYRVSSAGRNPNWGFVGPIPRTRLPIIRASGSETWTGPSESYVNGS